MAVKRKAHRGGKLNVAVVTGTRAEFGIWRPVLEGIQASNSLRLQLVVTGMHLQREFGDTVGDIALEGFEIAAKAKMYGPKDDSPADALARGTARLARVFRKLESEIVMVLGDRLEILAAAGAALAEQLPIAHVHGGESAPGQWDEQIRHAVTKMAHLHFVATEKAGRRVRQMGEDPKRVFVVGAPAIDRARWAAEMMKAARHEMLREGIRPMLVLHPTGPDERVEEKRALLVIDELVRAFPGVPVTAIGPNNDPGHQGILLAYKKRARDVDLVMSVSQDLFWGLMNEHGLLVGNSSSGIIEAATFGAAVINIGPRQAGRERSGNVIDVGFDGEEIARAVGKALSDKAFARRVSQRKNVYGDGQAAGRIVNVLEGVEGVGGIGTVKQFADKQ